jgi:hypothetical protein
MVMPRNPIAKARLLFGSKKDRIGALTLANGALRDALRPFAAIGLVRDRDPRGEDMIDAPDLAISARMVREARKALNEW